MKASLMLVLSTLSILFTLTTYAQSPGDTIVVQSLVYGATTRDTVVEFPDLEGISYRKVLMQYNMRCHDGLVNTSGGNGIACGEWDYSCNTYLHDPDRIDSVNASTPSHSISGFTGSSFAYSTSPTYVVYQTEQLTASVDDVISETEHIVGTNSFSTSDVLPTSEQRVKSQFLFTASELTNSGLTPGSIDAIDLHISNGEAITNFLSVKIKSLNSAFNISSPELNNWNEVYNANTEWTNGVNRIQFIQPFEWNGISNIAIELSYTNSSAQNNIEFEAQIASDNMSVLAKDDSHFEFNGANYIEADDYKGISGNDSRTVEAWIKTSVADKEIVSWGTNNTSQKWVFRVNDDGSIRVEVNGGFRVGSTNVADGEWHHVACVFEGSTISDVQLYVDGELEANSSTTNADVNTNVIDGINVRISRGVNNRYFDGLIDDVRIWDTALSGETIANWMYSELSVFHPNMFNLKANYSFDEADGNMVESSGPTGNASAHNGGLWGFKRGADLFKKFEAIGSRPKATFIQGEYSLSINSTIVNDTVFNAPNPVTEYEIVPNYNTLLSDDIIPISYNTYWEASQNIVLNPQGEEVSSTVVEPEGIINITDMIYAVRTASKIELMSFVTPYGIQLDLGPDGRTYTFDMTDYIPVFNGTKRLTMERGGQWQEEFDISFLFIVGTPPRDVLDLKQIWRVDYPSYNSIANNTYFEPRDVPTLATGDKFKIRSSITGHGQEGEFIPRIHYIDIGGGSNEFSWQVWKECADNPVYPQGGTWIYDRAGWCPGAATDIEESDITEFVTPGESVNIDYGINIASGTSNYIVSHQLVTYGTPNFAVDANIIEVERPSNRVEFAREGAVCSDPTVLIQNAGSETLTSVTINYWVNDNTEPQSYQWTGNLDMMESESVVLPAPADMWDGVNPDSNIFHAELVSPNGQTDMNPQNDTYKSAFNLPAVVPSNFIILFRTNNFASENHYEIKDADNNIVFSRNNMDNNTLYSDTLELGTGCYTYIVYDNDDDGINFWANNDGGGYTRFKQVGGPTLQFFEGDFGDDIQFPFTIDYPLAFEEIIETRSFELYPNPTKDVINIALSGFDNELDILIYNSLGQRIYSKRVKTNTSEYQQSIDFSQYESGVYVIRINDGTKTVTKRFVKD